MTDGWRFWATTLHGDGSETLIAQDVAFSDVSITKTLSGPDGFTAKLTPEHPVYQGANGRPIFLPWSTAIYAARGGAIRCGTIVTGMTASAEKLSVEAAGFSAYLEGMPWTNSTRRYYDRDPADVVRDVWRFAQMHPRGNLPLEVVPAEISTRVRVGERRAEVKDAGGETIQQAVDEPVLLARWETTDLGAVFEEMCELGSIDYVEEHETAADGRILHRLRLGHPRIGRRRTDIGFVAGVNVVEIPDVDLHVDDYASEVLVLAAGEGEKMLTAHATNPKADRLRKVRVVQEKGVGRQATANASAELRVKRLNSHGHDVDSLVVMDHPLAPLFGFELGDEVRLTGDSWWGGRLDHWVRVLEVAYQPTESDARAVVTVTRADKT